MNDIILELKDVWKTYDGKKSNALVGVDLLLKKNTLNIILGPSGSGKTTLLNIISLLDAPTSGEVIINGKNTSKLSQSKRSKIRLNEIGIVYQRENLFPFLNILENVMLPMISKDKERAIRLLKDVNIENNSKFPEEISPQQKVALARAMINSPSLILLDEPTGELDVEDTKTLMSTIRNLKHIYTILLVSDNSDLAGYADNLFSLKNGKLEKAN